MDWSYIAGYFDGEGHVGLHPAGRSKRTKITALVWYNSHLGSLEAIHAYIGVGRVVKGPPGSLGGKKQMYQLRITSKLQLLHAIDGMLPHLIIKREAAEALRQHLIDHVDETRMEHFGAVAAISTEQLTQWYHGEGKSYAEIAALLQVGAPAIAQAFRLRGLEARPVGGAFHTKGVPKSAETRARMSAGQRKRWDDALFRETHLPQLSKARAMVQHRSGGSPPGEAHPQAKLTDEKVRTIRSQYAEGATSLNKLAMEYDVSKKTVLNIVHRKIWTHI